VTLPDNANVIDLLVHQHQEVKRALAEVETLDGDAKAAAFARLEKLLLAHEHAEQEVVHPAVRDLAGEPGIARERVVEEEDAAAAMNDLHAMGTSHPDFDVRFAKFRDSVLEHAGREEVVEFPRLRATQSAERLVLLADELRSVQAMR
jgi:hemerythrin superfamily protein